MADTLALTVASLMGKWVAEGFAKEAGKSALNAMSQLYESVRLKLSSSPENNNSLAKVEEDGTNEERTQELASEIEKCFSRDNNFRITVQDLLQNVLDDDTAGAFATIVGGNAKVGKITNISNVKGDVNF